MVILTNTIAIINHLNMNISKEIMPQRYAGPKGDTVQGKYVLRFMLNALVGQRFEPTMEVVLDGNIAKYIRKILFDI